LQAFYTGANRKNGVSFSSARTKRSLAVRDRRLFREELPDDASFVLVLDAREQFCLKLSNCFWFIERQLLIHLAALKVTGLQVDWSIGLMSDAKVGLSTTVWVEVAGLFIVVLDFVNAFGFVPLHVLKPVKRITVSINMLFGIAARYSRESATALQSLRGATRTTGGVPRSARHRAREHP